MEAIANRLEAIAIRLEAATTSNKKLLVTRIVFLGAMGTIGRLWTHTRSLK